MIIFPLLTGWRLYAHTHYTNSWSHTSLSLRITQTQPVVANRLHHCPRRSPSPGWCWSPIRTRHAGLHTPTCTYAITIEAHAAKHPFSGHKYNCRPSISTLQALASHAAAATSPRTSRRHAVHRRVAVAPALPPERPKRRRASDHSARPRVLRRHRRRALRVDVSPLAGAGSWPRTYAATISRALPRPARFPTRFLPSLALGCFHQENDVGRCAWGRKWLAASSSRQPRFFPAASASRFLGPF